MTRTRFAPSPNGSLHLGHAYSAIVAYDLARERGGRFLLRIEDIDGARSRPDLVQEFREDLAWLGLTWDEEALQSDRLARYEAAADTLRAMGLLYRCQCSRTEVVAAATRRGPNGPLYPGTCKHRAIEPRIPCNWRLDIDRASALTGPLSWTDERAGEQRMWPDVFGDVVLVRKDEPASYHLAATVDDAADGVTLVTRGLDLFLASHVHRLLQALLELPVPTWHHHPLLLEGQGGKLAKRRNSAELGFGIAERRLAGDDGRALADALRAGRFPTGITLGERLDSTP